MQKSSTLSDSMKIFLLVFTLLIMHGNFKSYQFFAEKEHIFTNTALMQLQIKADFRTKFVLNDKIQRSTFQSISNLHLRSKSVAQNKSYMSK